MPTSVLLAVLTAAGLLALAPALTRRSDPPAPSAASVSGARVLSRHRRRRTVPGAHPVRPARVGRAPAGGRTAATSGTRSLGTHASPAAPEVRSRPTARGRRTARDRRTVRPRRAVQASRRGPRRNGPTALHRRRRVFVALILLNVVELAGVLLVGPGFWIGFSVAFVVLLADMVYLRRRAVAVARRRRRARRRQAWVAAQQAAIRREHERRAARRAAIARTVAESRRDARRLAIPRTERYPRRAQ